MANHSTTDVRLSDVHLACRKAEEAANRRFQAAEWLGKMVGQTQIPHEPSEEELRLCLRNGSVLCHLINKIHPGAVPKVVDILISSSTLDGGLSAYQYFENLRNFLVAAKEMRIPTFEISDLEQSCLVTGSITKVVDCILALKSYHEWRQTGGLGVWKYAALMKSPCQGSVNAAKAAFTSSISGMNPGDLATRKCSQPWKRRILTDVGPACQAQLPLCDEPAGLIGYKFGGSDCQTNTRHWESGAIHHDVENFPCEFTISDSTSSLIHDVCIRLRDFFQLKPRPMQDLPILENQGTLSNIDASIQSLSSLVRTIVESKQSNELPSTIDIIIKRIIEEFQGRLLLQGEQPRKGTPSKTTHNQEGKLLKLNEVKALFAYAGNEVEGLKHGFENTRQDVLNMKFQLQKEFVTFENQLSGIVTAAAGYHKVLAENRRLYNEVQDLKGNIRVYCRVRPFLPGQGEEQSTVDFIGENGEMMIVNPNKHGKDARKTFTFNKVFGISASQESVFLDTQPLIRSVLDGYNVCIFAYGQTGSGKTYTMTGPDVGCEESRGVNYRALNDLFQMSHKRKDEVKYEIKVQMLEIYNELLRDLLAIDGSNKKLEIRNSSQQNGINVPDATMLPVTSTSDVLDLMDMGHKNRSVSSTALNERSSRSHSVLTVHVQGVDLVSGAILRGCLHLVDLAGSERVDKSEVTGNRLKEAQFINKSLSALGDVISALSQKSAHVPYRNSKLTQLLQDALGGQAKALMFVHISPDIDSYSETLSTLKFAERVASVELGAARSNRETGELRELKEQVSALKEALSKKESEIERFQSIRYSQNGTVDIFNMEKIRRSMRQQVIDNQEQEMRKLDDEVIGGCLNNMNLVHTHSIGGMVDAFEAQTPVSEGKRLIPKESLDRNSSSRSKNASSSSRRMSLGFEISSTKTHHLMHQKQSLSPVNGSPSIASDSGSSVLVTESLDSDVLSDITNMEAENGMSLMLSSLNFAVSPNVKGSGRSKAVAQSMDVSKKASSKGVSSLVKRLKSSAVDALAGTKTTARTSYLRSDKRLEASKVKNAVMQFDSGSERLSDISDKDDRRSSLSRKTDTSNTRTPSVRRSQYSNQLRTPMHTYTPRPNDPKPLYSGGSQSSVKRYSALGSATECSSVKRPSAGRRSSMEPPRIATLSNPGSSTKPASARHLFAAQGGNAGRL